MAYFYNLKNILDPPKNKMEGKIFIGYLKVIQTFLRCLDSFVPLILKQKKKHSYDKGRISKGNGNRCYDLANKIFSHLSK